jgi:hypothetical protein
MDGEMSVVRDIFVGQSAHAFLLLSPGVAIWLLAGLPGFFAGEYAGLPTHTWFVLVVANSVVHKLYVAFYFRSVAEFSHACIWGHYLTTEKPDMQVTCGPESSG